MTRRPTIGHLLALLAVVGLMLAPLVQVTMAMGTADHAMPMAAATVMGDTGMGDAEMAGVMADMPCCPHKAPMPDCGNDCPFMALCSAMPFGVPVASLVAPLTESGIVRPGDQSGLVSVTRAPPRKPPKHPGSYAVIA
jgi:hypothetical protein